MVLPLLLGLGGSLAASAGLLGGMGALTAGAIGSGLGAYLQSGDLGEGISTGLMSFAGGKLLGGLGSGAGAMANPANSTALSGWFTDPTKGIAGQGLKEGWKVMMGKDVLPYALGSQVGGLAGLANSMGGYRAMPKPSKKYSLGPAPDGPQHTATPFSYRHGYDPEFNYGFPYYNYRNGGMVRRRFAQGGMVDGGDQLIMAAVAVIQGQITDEAQAAEILGQFVMRFGEQALSDLIDRVAEAGESAPPDSDGLSDSIPAMVDGQEPVALSEGEFVIPSDVVSGIGNGSTDAGARRLQDMIGDVRRKRTGGVGMPRRVSPFEVLPA